MKQYKELIEYIFLRGEATDDRTGVGTISVFGTQHKYDLRLGFPLVTIKKTQFNSLVRELIWFLKGSTNINDGLTQHTKIWDAWADKDGELGDVYGKQWRRWDNMVSNGNGGYTNKPIDQISEVIKDIKTNPTSRRLIVSAWNPAQIKTAKLPPCHSMFQFKVVNGRLDCMMTQRSGDVLLGVPFNIASYALLMILIANECNLTPGIFTHSIGDAHIYKNHIDGARLILNRDPLPLPSIKLNVPVGTSILDIKFEDIELVDYKYHPAVKFEVAV